jgi:hypothetical protein
MGNKIIIVKQEPKESKCYRYTAKNIAFIEKEAARNKANPCDIINAIIDKARGE